MRKKESNRRETNIRWKIKSYDVNKKHNKHNKHNKHCLLFINFKLRITLHKGGNFFNGRANRCIFILYIYKYKQSYKRASLVFI